MKKYIIVFFLIVTNLQVFSQRIDVDIFGNLQYKSERQRYEASLKKNIFDDLIFTDNNRNEVIFEKKYLDLQYRNWQGREDVRTDIFRDLIRRYQTEREYRVKHSVDIFGKIIIEDNRNNRTSRGTDIFGNPVYEERRNGVKTSFERDIFGNLIYKSNRRQASLKKDIFNKWSYSDSGGNKFEFSDETWNRLMRRYGNDENVFMFLIDEVFNY